MCKYCLRAGDVILFSLNFVESYLFQIETLVLYSILFQLSKGGTEFPLTLAQRCLMLATIRIGFF